MSENRIRPMTMDDLDQVRLWRNHPDVRKFMYTGHMITTKEHRNWFERCESESGRHLLIYEVAGVASGFASLGQLGNAAIADWGFYLSPDAPKGTGRGLGQAVLDYAFGPLELHKVCGQALAFNEQSVRFHNRLGFQREGVLRDQHFDGQQYHSVICFGLLDREWLMLHKER